MRCDLASEAAGRFDFQNGAAASRAHAVLCVSCLSLESIREFRAESRFDFVFASRSSTACRIHVEQDPRQAIDLLARTDDRPFVWTHYNDERRVAADATVAATFRGESRASIRVGHTLHR
jgi:hypothetical protein